FLSAQNSAYNIDHVLLQIEKNNSMLNALQKKAEADKIGNYTGNYLSNPEFELNYLWGTPAATGNRTDLRIHQSFDFPTAYQFRKQISSIKNAQVELEYQRQRQELLLYSGLILYDLIYTNALLNNL